MAKVNELLASDTAVEKLGRRGISREEALQLSGNSQTLFRNTGRRHRSNRELHKRQILIGHTAGGRLLTLVVERTIDPTTWLIVTGWESTSRERKMMRG